MNQGISRWAEMIGRRSKGRPVEPAEDELLSELRGAFPAAPPSDRLRMQVNNLAQWYAVEAIRRRQRPRLPLRAAMALGTLFVVFSSMLLLAPKQAGANIIERMEAALDGVQSAHVIQSKVEGGSAEVATQVWYRSGRWRLQDPFVLQVFADGKRWTYDRKQRTTAVEAAGGLFSNTPREKTFAEFVREVLRLNDDVTFGTPTEMVFRGRPSLRIVIRDRLFPERTTVIVERATGLPMHWVVERRLGETWAVGAEYDAEFGKPLPAHLFAPPVPGASVPSAGL